MIILSRIVSFIVLTLILGLGACSSITPPIYTQIDSAPKLLTNLQSDSDKIPYKFSAAADWKSYTKIAIDPVVIYRGPDQQFGTLPQADRAELAAYMAKTFSDAWPGGLP